LTKIDWAGPGAASGFRLSRILRAALAASVAVLFVASFPGEADAQARKKPAYKKQTKRDVPIRHPFGENMPKGPLQLVVSIADQRLTLYANGQKVATAPVSTGTPSHPTPYGIFSVIQKNRWHRSNLYGNAPMWYMHRLTWSGIALHEGHLPGRPASHGCIRLPQDFVSRLWSVSKLGVRVVVSPREITFNEFSHAKLFNPKQKPVDSSPSASAPVDRLRSTLDTASADHTQGQGHVIQVAQLESATTTDALPPMPTETQAGEGTPTASEAAVPAVSTEPSTVTSEAQPSAPEPRSADEATAVTAAPAGDAEPTPAAAEPTAIAAETPTPTASPTLASEPSTSEPTPTGTVNAPMETSAPPVGVLEPSARVTTSVADPDKPAIDPAELMLPRPAPLRNRAGEPPRISGQVAVFVSRKEKKIFVRQGFIPLFDMPVEIADLDRPLGTHLYTAMEIKDEGARMRWNVLSMAFTVPPGTPPAPRGKAKATAKKKNVKQAPKKGPEIKPASNATEALDRVTIPQEAIDRISELLVPGSSLIISDEGLGRETGRYTEFIVVTR
jgi:hypothetical protein